MQTTWHRLIGASKPLGWDNQIPAEPALLVSYLHKERFKLGTDFFEVVPHGGVTLGNMFTLARAGATGALPTASTCFNMLKMPPYATFAEAHAALLVAARHGSEGFEWV